MKKLDLYGGEILRKIIKNFQKDSTERNFGALLACLRDSEVWIPIDTYFADVDEDYDEEEEVVRAKKLKISPFILETKEGESFLTVYSWLDQMKKLHDKDNIIKLSFLDCMSWALSYGFKGIVVDVETNPFTVNKEIFDDILRMQTTAEDEYIYAKVRLKSGGRAYYYQTNRHDFVIGDRVIVPFGQYNKQKIGTIVKIEKYDSDHLPRSYFSTKYIDRKVNEEKRVPRNRFIERILLQEKESYEIMKNIVEKEMPFSFEAYYNTIFAQEGRYYGREEGDWSEYVATNEQRKALEEKCKSAFDELDERKPKLAHNSIGTHYANELFNEEPSCWRYSGDLFAWAYLSREFSSIPLPLEQEKLKKLFFRFLSFIHLPKEGYREVKVKEFSHRELTREVSRNSLEDLLNELIKNLKKFDDRMAELAQKEVYRVPESVLISYFGKDVEITTIRGKFLRGKVDGYVSGSNGFVSLSIVDEEGKKEEITSDEIENIWRKGEKTISENEKKKEYCFVGVSPRGQYDCNYWYIDEQGICEVGGYVWAPMGRNNKEQIVHVDTVRYCNAEDAPFSVEKAKKILRATTKEEAEEAELAWDE